MAYRVAEHIDAGLRLWGNIAFAGETDKVFVVEPEIRAHFMHMIHPTLGVILPVVGSSSHDGGKALTDPRWTGIRLGVNVAL